MTKTLDDSTVASFPGNIRLSIPKLRTLQPEIFEFFYSLFAWQFSEGKPLRLKTFWLNRIEEQLLYGDSRAAVVVSVDPLLVAAYTDEIDCVVLLRFNKKLVSQYQLNVGSRLITVNTYEEMTDGTYESDLRPGPRARGYWRNFSPIIADFLTDDTQRVEERKAEIDEDEWLRTEEMGQEYLREEPELARDGRPCWSWTTAAQADIPSESKLDYQPPPISVLEIPKRIFGVIFFAVMSVLVLVTGVASRGTRLLILVIFGAALVASIVSLWQLPRDLKRRAGVREAFKFPYAKIGIAGMSILFGISNELIAGALSGFWPVLGIWLGAFVTTVLFFPFRGDMKADYPTLGSWILLAATWGSLSAVLALVLDWAGGG